MESSGAETSVAAVSSDDLLTECWSSNLSIAADDPLHHVLIATDQLVASMWDRDHEAEDESHLLALGESNLQLLIELLQAERAFLFRVDGNPSAGSENLDVECLIAINLDGEVVQHPEKKADLAVVRRVATNGTPASQQAAADDSSSVERRAESFFLAFPLEIHGKTKVVLFVDNRFRPLATDQRTLVLCRVYCRVLVAMIEKDHLRRENRSLWNDVTNLREASANQQGLSPERSKYVHVQPSRGTKRSDLKGDYSMIVGNSANMIEIFHILDRISTSNAPVLINGESGTGKELIANAIHKNGTRSSQPFVSENCGALTETLLESELFGYMKGAFTGATKDRKGLFELATGGTLFLDEVGDTSPSMQKKLLRVLQEKVVRRVGGKELIPVDVRVISATNKHLLQEVQTGNFREDLYYRLNVINLKLPPLRERKDDIPDIVEYYLGALGREHNVEKPIEPAAMRYLMEYEWPGNIRELQNEVKRLYALSEEEIRVIDISEQVLRGNEEKPRLNDLESDLVQLTLRDAVERMEEHLIRHALINCRGNKSLVAKKLQVPKTSLYNKIKKYGLNRL